MSDDVGFYHGDATIEVSHDGGHKAFHQRGQFDTLMRCGRYVTKRVTAGAAIAAGGLPCGSCFPYDSIKTWVI